MQTTKEWIDAERKRQMLDDVISNIAMVLIFVVGMAVGIIVRDRIMATKLAAEYHRGMVDAVAQMQVEVNKL